MRECESVSVCADIVCVKELDMRSSVQCFLANNPRSV